MLILFCSKIARESTKMTPKRSLFLLMCLCFSLSEPFSVDNLLKCSIKDNKCQKTLYQNVIKEAGKAGIPELNIPPLDPIALKNVDVGIVNVVNVTLVDGVAKGIKDCTINNFEIDIEKGIGKQDITCDFTLKGHYSLFGDSDLLKRVLGNGGLRGNGKGKVKIEKLNMNLRFPVYLEKRDDGEIYMKWVYKKMEYSYDIKGKASFAADNIFVGKENISDLVVSYLNDNWKYVLKSFGKAFVDKAMEFYFDFAQKFFEGVPTKYYVLDDLTPYLKD